MECLRLSKFKFTFTQSKLKLTSRPARNIQQINPSPPAKTINPSPSPRFGFVASLPLTFLPPSRFTRSSQRPLLFTMRFAPILVVLAAPLLALSKVVINNTSYSGGHLTLGISTYSDAPSSFNVVAVDGSGNKITIGTVTTQGSGTFDLALPGNATPGSYKVQVVDPA